MDPVDNPYEAPKANLETPASHIEVPQDVLKKIRNGWIVAVIGGCITLLVAVVSLYGVDIAGLGGSELFIDVGLMFVLAYGIYRKSRVAATIMVVYFMASKIIIWIELGTVNGIAMTLVFLYFYSQAMIGAYQYHKLMKNVLT